MATLRTKKLVKSYSGRPVVRGVSLDVESDGPGWWGFNAVSLVVVRDRGEPLARLTDGVA